MTRSDNRVGQAQRQTGQGGGMTTTLITGATELTAVAGGRDAGVTDRQEHAPGEMTATAG